MQHLVLDFPIEWKIPIDPFGAFSFLLFLVAYFKLCQILIRYINIFFEHSLHLIQLKMKKKKTHWLISNQTANFIFGFESFYWRKNHCLPLTKNKIINTIKKMNKKQQITFLLRILSNHRLQWVCLQFFFSIILARLIG